MLSDDDIIQGYRWLLGRTPSAAEIAANRAHYADNDALALQRGLTMSDEARFRRLALHKMSRSTPTELDQDRLVFVHIEKCGGTTLHEMLAAQFEAGLVCPERHDMLGDWTVNELARFTLFSGHFDLFCCRSIPGRLRLVTMLREPKARLLSLYRFWKSHRPHPERDAYVLIRLARECTAEAFFAHPDVVNHRNIRNAMTGQMIRTSNRTLGPEDLILSDPKAALELAWTALQGFTGLGLLERFEDSRLLLNHALGLHMQPIAPRQVLAEMVRGNDDLVPVAPEPPSARLDATLEPLVAIDRALYDRARTLFEQRLMALNAPASGKARALPWTRWGRGPQTP